MERPILIITLGYITGIITGLYCKISIAFLYIAIVAIYYIIKNFIKIKKLNKYFKVLIGKNTILVFIIISIFSNTITLFKNIEYENKYKLINKANFKATVVSDKTEKEYYSQYKIKVNEIHGNKKYNNTYLLLNTKDDVNLSYGDKISFYGEYKEPEIQRNYKGFSYKEYLKSIGVFGTVEADLIKKTGQDYRNPVKKLAMNMREQIKKTVSNNIEDEDKKNLLLGILLGYDDNLSDTVKENFENSGLSHILAVSGIHVSYILLGITYLLKKLNSPKKLINIVTIIFLIFFIFLTSETPSVKRACIMTILFLISGLIYRKSDTITNLSMSLLLILIQNPYSIINLGLILSYLATIGIVYMNFNFFEYNINYKKNINNFSNQILNKVKQILKISISAQIFIIPISILQFNKITLTFLFANLSITFIISAILILGFISIIIPNSFIYNALEVLLNIIMQIANFFANLPISKIIITTPSIISIILYYVIIIVFIYIKKLRKKPIKRNIEKQILISVEKIKYLIYEQKLKIFLSIVFLITIVQTATLIFPKLSIHFIDVGQGDSCLIITPRKKTILIDGGGNTKTETFDVGKQTLLPYLLDRKIKIIDYLVVSHFDSDHVRRVNVHY